VLATLFGSLLFFDRSLGDQPSAHRIEDAYPVRDAQFVHTMSDVPGPGFSHGNKARTLLNGKEIFPPCWKRSALPGTRLPSPCIFLCRGNHAPVYRCPGTTGRARVRSVGLEMRWHKDVFRIDTYRID
jgi:hypothetical protein